MNLRHVFSCKKLYSVNYELKLIHLYEEQFILAMIEELICYEPWNNEDSQRGKWINRSRSPEGKRIE